MKQFEVTTDVLKPDQYKEYVTYPRLDTASLQVALNEEYAPGTEQVKPRDRVAFIPPVSGG